MEIKDKFNIVPAEMRDQARWVTWRAEERGGKKTKVPYQPHRPQKRASSTDPATWSDLDTALDAVERHGFNGVGFMFGGSGLVGVDLDHCFLNGELRPWAKDIWDQLAPVSYCEFSPSGDGLHFITRGALPAGAWNKVSPVRGFSGTGIEVYDNGRYFTVTGDADMTYQTIGDGADAIAWLQAEHAKKTPEKTRQDATREPTATQSDLDIMQRAGRAANGAKFDALMAGDLSEFGGDHSRADAALCAILAFWTRDPAQIDRIFRLSQLMRDKWDKKHGRDTYGAITIEKALATVTESAQDRTPGPERSDYQKVTENYQSDAPPAGNPFDSCLNVAELLEVEPPAMQWFAKERVPQGRGIILTGVGGVSKSTMLKQLGFAAVLGRAPWSWEFERTGKALLMLTEDTADDAHTSLRDIADAMQLTPTEKRALAEGLAIRPFAGQDSVLMRKDERGRLCRSTLYEQLLAKVKAMGNCVFVGIDPALAVSEGDELDQQNQRALAKMADDLAVNTGATVMLVTHGGKALINADEVSSHSSRGGGAVTDGARGEYVLRSMTKDEAKRAGIEDAEERARMVQLVCTKGNRIPPSAKVPLWLRRGNGGVLSEVVLDMTTGATCTTAALDDKIFEVLLDIGNGGAAKLKDWQAACEARGVLPGKTDSTKGQYMKTAAGRLREAGRVESFTKGYYLPCNPEPD